MIVKFYNTDTLVHASKWYRYLSAFNKVLDNFTVAQNSMSLLENRSAVGLVVPKLFVHDEKKTKPHFFLVVI